MPMFDNDIIVVGGAPGVGKSTLCLALRERFAPVYIEFSSLRSPHLDPDWSDQSADEEAMAFENFVSVARNYVRHGYRNIVATDFRDHRLATIPQEFADLSFRIVTLVLRDERELRRRLGDRLIGFRNADEAIAWNTAVRERPTLPHEVRIEADGLSVDDLIELASDVSA